jgi:phosphopantothenoylcysteine decarboxylase/phosphopantothenate--cysteine ligase
MHPSRAIRGKRSHLLSRRRIVVGISGSIAAIEIPRVIRELIRHGADVQAVMSGEAARLVTPEAITFASGHEPVQRLTGAVEHVEFFGPGDDRADLLLIAPATANTISKIAHGMDDTPVTSCASMALGANIPILIAPAMHAQMAGNPAVRQNLEQLTAWGIGIIRSQSAEGEEKLATPDEIAAAVLQRLAGPPWAGKTVIVIGGASRESIDAVRSVTNESSGATAVALATQAHYRGAKVRFWAGAVSVPIPSWLEVTHWRSVGDLEALVRARASDLRTASAVLVPAAISDFTFSAESGKISSRDRPTLTLTLERAPKILTRLRRAVGRGTLLVGFKLEAGKSPDELIAGAQALLKENRLDWVAANDQSSLGSKETTLLVVTKQGTQHPLHGPKEDVAGKLLDDLGRELANLRVPAVGTSSPTRQRPSKGRRGRS